MSWCSSMLLAIAGAAAPALAGLESSITLLPATSGTTYELIAGELSVLDQPAATTPPAPAAPTKAAPAAPEIKPEISFWNGWKRNADFGLNGSEGNSQSLSVRALIGATRKTDSMETIASVGYSYGTSSNKKSRSRGEAVVFNNWDFGPDTRWGFFAQGKAEYDEFQIWDWRFSGAVGPSYAFIKEEKTTLRGRAGVGASYKTGGSQDPERIEPELDLGLDYSHTFKEGHRMFANADYYPSLDKFPNYRAVAQAGYEILIDKDSGLLLKLGIQDRYDSKPGAGFKKNDIEYFVTMSFNF